MAYFLYAVEFPESYETALLTNAGLVVAVHARLAKNNPASQTDRPWGTSARTLRHRSFRVTSVSHGGPGDHFVDIAVWSDDLLPWVANPLPIELRLRVRNARDLSMPSMRLLRQMSDDMPASTRATIAAHLAIWDDPTVTNAARGKAFEELDCDLLGNIPGVTITSRNELNTFRTEEIEIACLNERDPAGLRAMDSFVLVECKGWANPISSVEVSWFLLKIEHRGLDFGVLFAANGITGVAEHLTAANFSVAFALATKKIRMVIITRAEVEMLASGEELAQKIIEKVTQLHASGRKCYGSWSMSRSWAINLYRS